MNSKYQKWLRFPIRFIGILLTIFFLYPVYQVAITSLMGAEEVQNSLSGLLGSGNKIFLPLLPVYPTIAGFQELLFYTPEFFIMFWNSMKQVLPAVAGQFLFSIPAAWALGVYRFRGREFLYIAYMLFMILPFQVMMLPQYLVLGGLSLSNTSFALILPAVFSAFPVFLLKNYFEALPEECLEAARVEGAGEQTIYRLIGLPMAKSSCMAVLLLDFMEYYSQMEQPLTFLKNRALWPLSLYIPELTAQTAGTVFCSALFIMLPPVFLALMGKDYLIEGLAGEEAIIKL